MDVEKPVTYEAWRATYQSSESAARAAFSACVTLQSALAIAQGEPDAPQMNSRAREWVDRAHRACMDPARPRQSIGEMLAALLDATAAPAPQQGGEE